MLPSCVLYSGLDHRPAATVKLDASGESAEFVAKGTTWRPDPTYHSYSSSHFQTGVLTLPGARLPINSRGH